MISRPSLLLLLCLALSFFTTESLAQQSEDPVQALLEASNNYQRQRPREKVYLHMSQTPYNEGQRIWFAVYAMSGGSHRASRISSRAKVRLLSPENVLVSERDVLLVKGTGSDFFDISESIAPGTYHIEASTEWLENFGKDYYFRQPIEIGEKGQTTKAREAIDCEGTTLTIHLTKDGLVAGLDQRVFVETNQNQKPLHLYNKAGEQIETLNPENGWGAFDLMPDATPGYYLMFEGCDQQFQLPQAKAFGVVMTVRAVGDQYQLVNLTSNDPKYQNHTFTGVIQSRGRVKTGAIIGMKNGKARALIENKELKGGISQILIIDEEGTPVTHRLIHRPLEELNTLSSLAQKSGRDIDFTVSLKDEYDEPLQGKFSVEVTNQPDSSFLSIEDFLYVESELKNGKLNQGDISTWLSVMDWKGPEWSSLKKQELPQTRRPLQSYINNSFSDISAYELDPDVRTVQGVTVTDKRLPEDEDPLKLVTGKGDVSVDFDDLGISDGESVLTALRGRVAGVYVRGSATQAPWNPPMIKVRGAATAPAYIFMDNNIELTAEELDMIPAVEIASVEIFKGPSAARWGTRGGEGVVMLYSRKNVKKRAQRKAKIPLPKQESFDIAKANKTTGGLLHWEPSLQTDEEGEINFSFKATPDTGNTVYLRIEGLTNNGEPISRLVPVTITP